MPPPKIPVGTATGPARPIDASRIFSENGPRFQLICHGMMMFHWDYQNDPDHITILMREMAQHVIALSPYQGAVSPLDGREHNLLPPGAGDYELQLTPNFHRPTHHPYKPDPSKDVVLDSRILNTPLVQAGGAFGGAVVQPQSSLVPNKQHVTHTLKLPFPTQVIRGRVALATRGAHLYTGATVSQYGVTPTEVAGMHVFTYEGAQAVQLIHLMAGTTISPPWFLDRCFRLYLYSEEREVNQTPHTLDDFNKLVVSDLLQVQAGSLVAVSPDLAKSKDEDAVVKSGGSITIRMYGDKATQTPPACLTLEDYYPLSCFHTQTATSAVSSMAKLAADTPALGAPPYPPPVTVMQVIQHGVPVDVLSEADPTECLQGWGT